MNNEIKNTKKENDDPEIKRYTKTYTDDDGNPSEWDVVEFTLPFKKNKEKQ